MYLVTLPTFFHLPHSHICRQVVGWHLFSCFISSLHPLFHPTIRRRKPSSLFFCSCSNGNQEREPAFISSLISKAITSKKEGWGDEDEKHRGKQLNSLQHVYSLAERVLAANYRRERKTDGIIYCILKENSENANVVLLHYVVYISDGILFGDFFCFLLSIFTRSSSEYRKTFITISVAFVDYNVSKKLSMFSKCAYLPI